MAFDVKQLRALSVEEKLHLIGLLWDDLSESAAEIALSQQTIDEVKRRQAELAADPSIAVSHDEMWRRIRESR